jgi:hypothetical protein
MIFVEGQLETRKWFQKDGAGKSESWTVEIAVAKLVILDREHFDDRAFEDEAPAVPDTAFNHGDGLDAEPDQNSDKIDATLPFLG